MNELCDGKPSQETFQFLRSLDRPLDATPEDNEIVWDKFRYMCCQPGYAGTDGWRNGFLQGQR